MTDIINDALTRMCAICGASKPLLHFLEITESDEKQYGSICTACRGASQHAEGDSESQPASIGIRGKEKLYLERYRVQRAHDLQKTYKQEKARSEHVKTKQLERHAVNALNEKKRKEGFLQQEKKIEVVAHSATPPPKTSAQATNFKTLVHALLPGRVEWQSVHLQHFLNQLSSDSAVVKALKGSLANKNQANKPPKAEENLVEEMSSEHNKPNKKL